MLMSVVMLWLACGRSIGIPRMAVYSKIKENKDLTALH